MQKSLTSKEEILPRFQLDVVAAGRPNIKLGSYPDIRISIVESNQSSLVWDPQLHSISEMKGKFQIHSKRTSIHGILGSFAIGNELILMTVDEIEQVGTILSHTIYKVNRVKFTSLSRFPNKLKGNPIKTRNELIQYKELIENGEFYFSYTYQLWNHLQTNSTKNQTSNGFDRYVWNSHLIGNDHRQPGLVHLIRGYFKSTSFSNGITMSILSKIDTRNAGTRFSTRGLNEDGLAAISVETEVILFNHNMVTSYIQYRGSLPLEWSQLSTEMVCKPPIIVSNDDNLNLIDQHFKDIENILPGKILLLNLLGKDKEEKLISKRLKFNLDQLNNHEVDYRTIPLGWGTEGLSKLLDELDLNHQDNLFMASLSKHGSQVQEIHQKQHTLIRTNCLDCLDRTTIAQFGIISELLPLLLQPLSPNPCPKTLSSLKTTLFPSFRHNWSDMSNLISNYHTGTGIINEPLIRYGLETPLFSKPDKLIYTVRYIQNNTYDIVKKYWLDNYLTLSTLPHPHQLPTIPLRHLKVWSPLLTPSSSSSFISMSTTTPPPITHCQLSDANPELRTSIYRAVKSQLILCDSMREYCDQNNLTVPELLIAVPKGGLLFSRL